MIQFLALLLSPLIRWQRPSAGGRFVGRLVKMRDIAVCLLLVLAAPAGVLPAQTTKPARLHGTVFDSTRVAPLANVIVEAVASDDPARMWRTITDSKGAFRFDSLPASPMLVVASHPRLDSLGVRQLSRGVELRGGNATRLRLMVPSTRTLVRGICGSESEGERSGYMRGVLRDAERPELTVQGEVQLRWLELSIGKGGLTRQVATIVARTDAEGRFTACGVPAEGTLEVRASGRGDSTGVLEFMVPTDGILLRDLHVGKSLSAKVSVREESTDPIAAAFARDSASDTTTYVATLRRGSTSLRVLTQRADGAPVPDARVTVWGTGAEQRTSTAGRATLSQLPTGSYTVEVRALGFAPMRQTVDLFPGDSGTLRLTLDKLQLLDPVRVAESRLTPTERRLRQFEDNRRMLASGRFITPEMIERSQPMRIADLFRTIPGTRIVPGMFGDIVVMRSPTMRGWCTPELWVDGVRLMNDMALDVLVSVQDLLAMEVYNGGALAPAQYSGLSGCGAILLYTGVRGAVKR